MHTNKQSAAPIIPGRVKSVDFFRGLTMFLLVGESTHLYEHFIKMDSGIMQFFGTQLFFFFRVAVDCLFLCTNSKYWCFEDIDKPHLDQWLEIMEKKS